MPGFDDSASLLIFDGHCVLCSRGVQFILARDPHGTTCFAAIQEKVPQALYAHYGLDADRFDTFMVLRDGLPYLKWKGVCMAARLMPAPWHWLGAIGSLVPSIVGDGIYDVVQRHRIGWFGAREVCFIPAAHHRVRLLPPAA